MKKPNARAKNSDVLLESFTQEDFEVARQNLMSRFRQWQGLLISNDEKSIITPDDLSAFRLQANEISEQQIKSEQEIEQLKILTVLIYMLTIADTSATAAYEISMFKLPDVAENIQYPFLHDFIVRKVIYQATTLDLETIEKLLDYQNQISLERILPINDEHAIEPETLAKLLHDKGGRPFGLINHNNRLYIEMSEDEDKGTLSSVEVDSNEPTEPIGIEDFRSKPVESDTTLEPRILLGEKAELLKDALYKGRLSCGLEICAATYVGVNREQNEDAIIISPLYDQLIVIDAMGGYGNGNVARDIFIQNSLKHLDDIEQSVLKTQKQYDENKLQYGGVCLTHLKVVPSNNGDFMLFLSQAGDVHTVLFDQSGKLRYESKDEAIGHRVFNAIISKSATDLQRTNGWNKFGKLTRTKIQAGSGWRLAIYSDGISNHFTADAIKPLILGNNLEDALFNISSSVDSAMREPESYQDNCSLVLVNL